MEHFKVVWIVAEVVQLLHGWLCPIWVVTLQSNYIISYQNQIGHDFSNEKLLYPIFKPLILKVMIVFHQPTQSNVKEGQQ